MRLCRFVLVGVVLLAAAVVGVAGDGDAGRLVGVWRVTKTAEKQEAKGTIEFTKDGKLKLKAEVDGKTLEAGGTYKLDGKKLTTTITAGEKSMTETGKVTKLTDKQLIVEDEKGRSTEFERVK